MDIQEIKIEVEPIEEGQIDALLTITSATHSGASPEVEDIINVLETALHQFYQIRNKRK